MRHESKTDRKSSMMRTAALFLFAVLLVCLVYSVDVSGVAKSSVNSISTNSDENIKNPSWTYICEDVCVRKEFDENTSAERTTLQTCNMLCGKLPLWPIPTSTKVTNKSFSSFTKNRIVIKLNCPDQIKDDLKQATNIFMENLPITDGYLEDYGDTLKFNTYINVSKDENKLKISTDESYRLIVTKLEDNIEVKILASSYFGARHGLETLSQLIWLDVNKEKLNIIHDVKITDTPKFPYRGLMVDTARNYFGLDQLKKVLNGMAATKLNVFHLHLTDASSFPVVLPRNELFAKYGAYSPEMVYRSEDIKDLVEYARIRGIRTILEVDAPSHVNENLNKVKDGLVICGEDALFNGHLNPQNNESLQVLEEIYEDLLDLGTDTEMFHIGGDEVNLTCWKQFVNDSLSTMSLWTNFTNKMFDTLISANKYRVPEHIILWSSDLTSKYVQQLEYKENVVVQYWYGAILPILINGNKVIFSTVGRWYLDCGYGSWKTAGDSGVCDPYATWHTFYKYQPWAAEFSEYKNQVLGGEACLWSEMVEVDSLETRIWPRAAAMAERLWSDPINFNRDDVYQRLDVHRQRLESRGIKSEAIWPRWCSQNPGRC
ncbi:probable beta-hexosaminidase fdl [Anoplophora glabripennis]|uniref:probable beta-hexosaminidase fdl n=1 Tax=Anoplophora glabripennis TaxID=217634 RepID=UPI0008748186|nr:probable beta-hexosaminidase fdl [Anoplophora glabripennis]